MLSPSMMTRSNGRRACTAAICCASSYCARSPVPLSPITANVTDERPGGAAVRTTTAVAMRTRTGRSPSVAHRRPHEHRQTAVAESDALSLADAPHQPLDEAFRDRRLVTTRAKRVHPLVVADARHH